MADWIPVVSQFKSLVQLIGGDKEGAKQTQINFSKQCPVVSQLRSLAEYVKHDSCAARQTQKEFGETVSGVVDAIPVVGHLKGVVHYAAGDKDRGDNAMKASSRTVGVLVAGAVGSLGGPPGAVAGGIAGGVIMDSVTSIVDSEVHGHARHAGYIKQIGDLKKNRTNPGKWFDVVCSVVGDGMTGFAAGKAVKNMTKVKTQDGVKNRVKGQLKKKSMKEKITVTETVKEGNLEKTRSVVHEFKTTETYGATAEGMKKSFILGAGVGSVVSAGVCAGVGVNNQETKKTYNDHNKSYNDHNMSYNDHNKSYNDHNKSYNDHNKSYNDHNKSYNDHNKSYNDHNNHDDADTVVADVAGDDYYDDDDDDNVNVTDSRKLSRKNR